MENRKALLSLAAGPAGMRSNLPDADIRFMELIVARKWSFKPRSVPPIFLRICEAGYHFH